MQRNMQMPKKEASYTKASKAFQAVVDLRVIWFIGAAVCAALAMALGRGNNKNPKDKHHIVVPFGVVVVTITAVFCVMQLRTGWQFNKCTEKTTFLQYLVSDAQMKVNTSILLIILGIYLAVMYPDNKLKLSWDTFFHFGCIACIYGAALQSNKDVPCPVAAKPQQKQSAAVAFAVGDPASASPAVRSPTGGQLDSYVDDELTGP